MFKPSSRTRVVLMVVVDRWTAKSTPYLFPPSSPSSPFLLRGSLLPLLTPPPLLPLRLVLLQLQHVFTFFFSDETEQGRRQAAVVARHALHGVVARVVLRHGGFWSR